MNENQVFVRCRPLSEMETARGNQVCIDVEDRLIVVNTPNNHQKFEFDATFSSIAGQYDIFEKYKDLIESALEGSTVSFTCFGSTASGKTYTMTGTPLEPGIAPNVIKMLFELIESRIRVASSFIELYCDNLVDLYQSPKKAQNTVKPAKLDIQFDGTTGVSVRNCVLKCASTAEELLAHYLNGRAAVTSGATGMNCNSGRSHLFFTITVETYDAETLSTTMGKIMMVDLAGKQRAGIGVASSVMKEIQSINQSLSALENVVTALSENRKHIPYRDSKLTQLMQDTLGGNAKSLMVVTVSPANSCVTETIAALQLATKLRRTSNKSA